MKLSKKNYAKLTEALNCSEEALLTKIAVMLDAKSREKMTFNRKDYERFSESLNCSEEILHAIEIVSGEKFRRGFLLDCEVIIENAAHQLWEDGGREKEILNALPTSHNPEEGEEIYWGGEVFAEFDEEKGAWIKK